MHRGLLVARNEIEFQDLLARVHAEGRAITLAPPHLIVWEPSEEIGDEELLRCGVDPAFGTQDPRLAELPSKFRILAGAALRSFKAKSVPDGAGLAWSAPGREAP